MATVWTQAKGSCKFGVTSTSLTDYSNAVAAVNIGFEADQTEIPATLGVPEVGVEQGAKARMLTVDYLIELAGTGLVWEFAEAFEANTPLFFEVVLEDGDVSEDNPMYTGQILVGEYELGGQVGELRRLSPVYPIRANTFATDTST